MQPQIEKLRYTSFLYINFFSLCAIIDTLYINLVFPCTEYLWEALLLVFSNGGYPHGPYVVMPSVCAWTHPKQTGVTMWTKELIGVLHMSSYIIDTTTRCFSIYGSIYSCSMH